MFYFSIGERVLPFHPKLQRHEQRFAERRTLVEKSVHILTGNVTILKLGMSSNIPILLFFAVRSLGSVALRMAERERGKGHFNYFVVEINEVSQFLQF